MGWLLASVGAFGVGGLEPHAGGSSGVGTLFSREGVGIRPGFLRHLENCIASTIVFVFITIQATKGLRWMPWRQEPKKDVAGCDKPR
jgi:hypothetical protein